MTMKRKQKNRKQKDRSYKKTNRDSYMKSTPLAGPASLSPPRRTGITVSHLAGPASLSPPRRSGIAVSPRRSGITVSPRRTGITVSPLAGPASLSLPRRSGITVSPPGGPASLSPHPLITLFFLIHQEKHMTFPSHLRKDLQVETSDLLYRISPPKQGVSIVSSIFPLTVSRQHYKR
jgi:hypothetical protein